MSADGNPDAALQTAAAKPTGRARLSATIRSNRRRFIIMASVPVLLLLVGGWLWLSGGRYVSTDNAYVQLDKLMITGEAAGRIVEVDVGENQAVKKGDLILRLDPAPYQNAVDQASAAVAGARLQVEQLRASYQQATAQLKLAGDNVAFQEVNFKRQQDLLAKGVASQATYDQTQNALQSAEQARTQAEQAQIAARAALGGNVDIESDQHPAVMQALAALATAKLNLQHTVVRAPANGIIAQTDRLIVGQYVTDPTLSPTPLCALVETDRAWVEANYKETDLNHMRVGQAATVWFDAYPGHKFAGTVESIGAGTGAEFAVLPAQNATGNWIKVVQRVPVRIHLTDPNVDVPLRSGLSSYVTVDTKAGSGTAAAAEPTK